MTDKRSYTSPAAFRRALTDRLRALADASGWPLQALQRQITYDRLLERLYLVDDEWILKGATALLARDIGVRGTDDIDVFRKRSRNVAERDLRDAIETDIGDWFRFEIGVGVEMSESGGVRFSLKAYIGPTVWLEFHVDLVGWNLRMTGQPDQVHPLAPVLMPNVEQHGYRAYPLVDHIADKTAAMFEIHGDMNVPSTRYRDLVDLVAIVKGATVEAEAQTTAMSSEFERRGLSMPTRFDVPDRDLWESGYAAEAGRSLLREGRTLDDALSIVRPFIEPVLTGAAVGRWDPVRGTWTA